MARFLAAGLASRAAGLRTLASLVVLAALVSAGCGGAPASTPESRALVTLARPVGAWQGTGSKSVGDVVSDTGRFRIHWEARNEASSGGGTFRLTVRSAVSGRPLQVVVDHHGAGAGDVEFDDGPRAYDFMVDSTNLEWSFTVAEVSVVYAPAKP